MPHKISIQFTRPRRGINPLSWIIRAVEGTPYSHVRLYWETARGEPCVYEASGSGLEFKGRLADEGSVHIVGTYHTHVTPEQRAALIDHCIRHSALDYGYLQILGIALVKLFRLKKNPLSRGRRRQVCSEVVLGYLEDILKLDTGLDRDTAGVKDIELALRRLLK